MGCASSFMNRIEIKYGGEVVPVMRLTSRVLARAGRSVEVVSSDGAGPSEGESLRLDWEEPVLLAKQLCQNWESLSGEEILERLEYILTTQDAGVLHLDLWQNLDLWLLKALAQEKCVYIDPEEVEKTYQHCRHLGIWNSVIVRNNLAVLAARLLRCFDSLKLFAEAIQIACAHKVPLKAPFYNAALIFQQLHLNGLIREPKYEAILREMAAAVGHGGAAAGGEFAGAPGQNGASEEVTGGRPEQPSDAHEQPADAPDEDDVRDAYKGLALYGFNIREPELKESEPRAFFRKKVAYLAPSVDLFESFGNSPDQVDGRNAQELIRQGNDLADHGEFEESVNSFRMAVRLDRSRESEVSARLAQLYDQWRYELNRRMSKLRDEGELDEASRVILELPDENLRRPEDAELVSGIRKEKHSKSLRDAEAADGEEARLVYIGLLKEPDLDDSLRLVASGRLAKRLGKIDDEEERHKGLSELILHGLHPEIISRLAEEFERRLVREASAHARLKQHGKAIRKYFWALLLPGRAHERERLLKRALFQLGLYLKSDGAGAKVKDIDSCDEIKDAVFASLKAELKDRWANDRAAVLRADFERLDSEPHLRRKRFDELGGLLEDLVKCEPTNEWVVARYRLTREAEAQGRLVRIGTLLDGVSKNANHEERRKTIAAEVDTLRGLAVDFAASEKQRGYAEQINDFVLSVEDLLRHADNQKFKHDRTFKANRRMEQAFLDFRKVFDGDSNGGAAAPKDVLETICRQLRAARGGRFFNEVTDLSLHWLREEAKPAYYGVAAESAAAAAAAIKGSLEIIARNQSVLPEEFTGDFKRFLEELAQEVEPPRWEEPPPPPPMSTPSPDGFLRRMAGWVRSQFR